MQGEVYTPPITEIQRGLRHQIAALEAGAYRALGDSVAARVQENAELTGPAGATQETAEPEGPFRLKGMGEVPILQFIFDATMRALSQPRVTPHLPREIAARSKLAQWCSVRVIELCAANQEVTLPLAASNELWKFASDEDVEYMVSPKYSARLERLVPNIFFEPTFAIGGAHRLLKRRRPDLNPVEVIERSTGLLITAGASESRLEKIWRALGYPYAVPRHLIIKNEGPPKVDFIKSTRDFIKEQAIGSGCPAISIQAVDAPGTVLTQSWERLVHYYVTPESLSNCTNTRLLAK